MTFVVDIRGGHWGLRYCSIGQLFMRYFGILNCVIAVFFVFAGWIISGVLVNDI